jgi:flagellar motility protein MotE (MotC chaperone)
METDEAYKKVQKRNMTRVEQIQGLREDIEDLKKKNEVGRVTR